MYLDTVFSQGHIGKIATRKTVKPIRFRYVAPAAQRVNLVGDFNQWNPQATPMSQQYDGAWVTDVKLTHGSHRYLFVVDEQLTLDSNSNGVTRMNELRVSLLSVS